jgi:hypothetical protein
VEDPLPTPIVNADGYIVLDTPAPEL